MKPSLEDTTEPTSAETTFAALYQGVSRKAVIYEVALRKITNAASDSEMRRIAMGALSSVDRRT